MAEIKNIHTSPINVDGVQIAPGQTGTVANWSKLKGRDLFIAWLAGGVIAVAADDEDPDFDFGGTDFDADARRSELEKLTKAELSEILDAADVEIADDAKKADMIAAVIAFEKPATE